MKFIGFITESMGIYKITNTQNNKVYIGRTSNFKKRHYQYIYDFKNERSRCLNNHLLNSYRKYGIECFEFEPIFYCFTEQETLVMENYFMDKYNSNIRDFGYNIRRDSEGGMITSEETSIKISNRLKKEWENGIRDSHSEKLKLSWNSRDRDEQGKLFSKILTKWYYVINDDFDNKLNYKQLKDIGCSSVISSFHRKSSNSVVFKGLKIERFKYEN